MEKEARRVGSCTHSAVEHYPVMRERIPGAYMTLKPSMLKYEPTRGALTEAWHGWLWSAGVNPGGSLEEVSTRSQRPKARD